MSNVYSSLYIYTRKHIVTCIVTIPPTHTHSLCLHYVDLSEDIWAIVLCLVFVSKGFLYISEFLHYSLIDTQYIAPLMANFDTQVGNSSHIRYMDNGE